MRMDAGGGGRPGGGREHVAPAEAGGKRRRSLSSFTVRLFLSSASSIPITIPAVAEPRAEVKDLGKIRDVLAVREPRGPSLQSPPRFASASAATTTMIPSALCSR